METITHPLHLPSVTDRLISTWRCNEKTGVLAGVVSPGESEQNEYDSVSSFKLTDIRS